MNKRSILILLAISISSQAMQQEDTKPVFQPNTLIEQTVYRLIRQFMANDSTSFSKGSTYYSFNDDIQKALKNIDQLSITEDLKQYLSEFYKDIKDEGYSFARNLTKVINGELQGEDRQKGLNILLSSAAHQGHENLVKFLLFLGANVNGETGHGDTILMWAAGTDQTEIVKLLLANGANINAKNEDGGTALSLAEKKGFTRTANLLRENGAK